MDERRPPVTSPALWLADPPETGRDRDLWLQHAAGFILFEHARGYAISLIDPTLDEACRTTAIEAIDNAIYGMMKVMDGVPRPLRNDEYEVDLRAVVRLFRRSPEGDVVLQQIDLRDGEGMTLGFHSWLAGDFGEDPVVVPAEG